MAHLYNWYIYFIDWKWETTSKTDYRNTATIYKDVSHNWIDLPNSGVFNGTLYSNAPVITEDIHGFTSYKFQLTAPKTPPAVGEIVQGFYYQSGATCKFADFLYNGSNNYTVSAQNSQYTLDVNYTIYENPYQGNYRETVIADYNAFNDNAVNTYNGTQYWFVRGVTDNTAPTKPSFTAPTNTIVIDHSYNIQWTQSTDSDGDTVKYQVDLSINNGSTYKNIATNLTTRSLNYDFSSESSTTTAILRVRAYDDYYAGYSAYSYSPVFTIAHAPTVPSFITPSTSVSIDTTYTITWNESNDPSGTDTVKYEIQLSTDGTNYNSIITNLSGGATSYNFASSSESTNAKLRIRAYDNYNNYSAWSYSNTFAISHGKAYIKVNGIYSKVPVYVKVNGVYNKASVYEKRNGTYVKM